MLFSFVLSRCLAHRSILMMMERRAGIGTAGAKAQNTSVYITGLPPDVTQSKIGEHRAQCIQPTGILIPATRAKSTT